MSAGGRVAEEGKVLRLLAAAAQADGTIGADEEALLRDYAVKMHLSDAEASAIIQEGRLRGKIALPSAKDEFERDWLLAEVINVMRAQGEINPRELALLKRIAAAYGVSEAELQDRLREPEPEAPPAPPPPKRDLAMEAHLAATAVWWRIWAVLAWIAAAILVVTPKASSESAGLRITILIVLALSGTLSYWIGSRLSKYSDGARLAAACFGALGVFAGFFQGLFSVIGFASKPGLRTAMVLAASLLSLTYALALTRMLFSERADALCSDAYRAIKARGGPEPNLYGSPFFWFPVAQLGLGLLILVAQMASG